MRPDSPKPIATSARPGGAEAARRGDLRTFPSGAEINPDYAAARYNLSVATVERETMLAALERQRTAIHSRPNDVALLNDTAWLLATNPNASIRNGQKAVEYAERAARLSGGREPAILGTLAAAYAEAGRFPEALQAAHKAIELAEQQNSPALVESIRAKVRLYPSGIPCRESPATADH